MLKAITTLAVAALVTILARAIYLDKIEEARMMDFISSGKFLTEEYRPKK